MMKFGHHFGHHFLCIAGEILGIVMKVNIIYLSDCQGKIMNNDVVGNVFLKLLIRGSQVRSLHGSPSKIKHL